MKRKHRPIQKLEHAESQNVGPPCLVPQGKGLLSTPKADLQRLLAYLQAGQGQSRTFIIELKALTTGTQSHLSLGALLLASMETAQRLWEAAHRVESTHSRPQLKL